MSDQPELKTARKIKTVFEFPPIPDRRFDWCAYHEGEEESGYRGWGRTEAEAVADLKQLEDERDDPKPVPQPGTRVRLYELPYCAKYWDGTVMRPAPDALSGFVRVCWDDGVISDAEVDGIEPIREGDER